MFKNIRSKKAQVISSEYVLIFFLVLAMITGMGVYFRRAVQARIYDARNYMGENLKAELKKDLHDYEFYGKVTDEYEPYYLETDSTVTRSVTDTSHLGQSFGLSSGVFKKTMDQRTDVSTESKTAPSRSADGIQLF